LYTFDTPRFSAHAVASPLERYYVFDLLLRRRRTLEQRGLAPSLEELAPGLCFIFRSACSSQQRASVRLRR